MHLSIVTPNPQAALSPIHGSFSPSTDPGDISSEDGDNLQTPLSEINHSYDVFHDNLTLDVFHSYSNQQFEPQSASKLDSEVSCVPLSMGGTSLSALSMSGPFYGHISSPPQALDLANASLELGQFTTAIHSHLLDPSASPFMPANQPFDFIVEDSNSPDAASASGMPIALPSPPLLSVTKLDDVIPDISLLAPIRPGLLHASQSEDLHVMCGRMYSPRFPSDHSLNPFFARTYRLGEELGAGGYGFVMTARHRTEGHEVAVKFIIKDKVPDHAWWEDDTYGRIPTEVMMLSLVEHDNIVKCLDLYEDELYFYLVQELHGTPWVSRKKKGEKQITAPGKLLVPSPSSTPSLTPSPSYESAIDSLPHTPPQLCIEVGETVLQPLERVEHMDQDSTIPSPNIPSKPQPFLQPLLPEPRPNFARRASHDLFECIEQSKHKRLSESQARYIFAQVVEAVHYLDSQGITHCDIKDENLVIDSDLKVKLIDFGSAVVSTPTEPRPYYRLFFGTTAYASSEILRKQPYQAPPAEIWTLGVLLSYLLTGHSPFPTEEDAIAGRVVLRESSKSGGAGRLSKAAIALLGRCLEPDPEQRATIDEVRSHRWLQGALRRGDTD